jgi:hypothetical protein
VEIYAPVARYFPEAHLGGFQAFYHHFDFFPDKSLAGLVVICSRKCTKRFTSGEEIKINSKYCRNAARKIA